MCLLLVFLLASAGHYLSQLNRIVFHIGEKGTADVISLLPALSSLLVVFLSPSWGCLLVGRALFHRHARAHLQNCPLVLSNLPGDLDLLDRKRETNP